MLDAIGEARAQIVHENHCALARTVSNVERDDQLCVGINRCPRPDVASAFRGRLLRRYVLLFGMAERPDFIALDTACLHIAHCFVMQDQAGLASFETVLIDTSTTRLIERMDEPSQSIARI